MASIPSTDYATAETIGEHGIFQHMMQNVHVKLNPGLPWQDSTRRRLFASKLD
jgi:hypothetical protein